MNQKWEEQIIVVPRKDLFNGEKLTFQGLETSREKLIQLNMNIDSNYTVKRRGDKDDVISHPDENMEINHDYKQPIPYAVLKRGNEIFVYERLKAGGESRLHNKLSIGVGGHMNMPEVTIEGSSPQWYNLLLENMFREINEEISFGKVIDEPKFNILGMINDDEDSVGKVHIGVLAIFELDEDVEISVKEKDQLAGYFMNIDSLKLPNFYDRMESWSKIVIDNI